MKVRIITASAGSGKTHRLTELLDAAIASGEARPDSIVATTFTTQAAAELVERARGRLLQSGLGQAAHQLLAARIGTVNAVCGALVTDFAFELGMSPDVRVLDEGAAEQEFRRALARVVSADLADELETFKGKFEQQLDWRIEVRRMVEAARANALDPTALAACAERSIAELDACLGPVTRASDLDADLTAAMRTALEQIAELAQNDELTVGTAGYVELLRESVRRLDQRRLPWGDWAKLAIGNPTKQALAFAAPVQAIAARHLAHPRMRAELHALIRILFRIASAGLAAYQAYKRERGVLDFVDQEALALEVLRRPDVRDALAGQLDLFLVDEFQDTSPIQLAVFLELAKLATTSIWVGDPKQAIYAFRGTDPSLMDAAIESLTSPITDAQLVTDAVEAIGGGQVETLGTSYRSRPELVALTSDVFARAFAHQGMPEERTRLEAALQTEPAGLGEIVEYWPIDVNRRDGTDNAEGRAAAVASGVRELLARRVHVREADAVRTARPGDLAVLCRTNAQCQEVADALATLDIAAIVPRMGVLDTLEAGVAMAGLALWIDPEDSLAAAQLARLITHPTDLEAIVTRALAKPGREAFRDEPAVARIAAARARTPDLGPLAALDAVLAATDLRSLCAAWGQTAQRLANLDALRAHATAYVGEAMASSDPVTTVGLLRYLEGLAEEGGWSQTRTDRQALRGGDDAVTVSTWHRAKGLEWPITILYGLESLREPWAHGVHVLSDRTAFDTTDPLGGRWIRYWPNPYTTTNQNGAVRAAYESSPAHALLVAKAAREALRVLYVGWTRARDRVVFAAKRGKLLGGIVGTLSDLDPTLIDEPSATAAGIERRSWAGRPVAIRTLPTQPAAPVVVAPVPGMVTIGRAPHTWAPARTSPSTAEPVPSQLGEVVELGGRIPIEGRADMEDVGHAVHGFLAADRPGLSSDDRLQLAHDLLHGYGVGAHLTATEVVAAATRLWSWIDGRFPCARLFREWPVAVRTAPGTLVAGITDLVVAHAGGYVLIDHKTFPGGVEAAKDRALGYAGQLAAYASAIRAATAAPVPSTWIHFPVLGRVIEIVIDLPSSNAV